MKLIEAAKKYLQFKANRSQAFFDKTEELNTKIADLNAKKSKLISDYDPTKPFNAEAVGKIEAEIASVEKELEVLNESKKVEPPAFNAEASIEHITGVKAEIQETLGEHKKEEEKLRQEILKAKQALLEAQASHFRLVQDSRQLVADTNETIKQLNVGFNQEIDNLRMDAQAIGRDLYNLATGTTFRVINGSQSEVDEKQKELDEVRRKIQKLESYTVSVGVPIPPLNNYRNNMGETVYFVHAHEQQEAVENGIVKIIKGS